MSIWVQGQRVHVPIHSSSSDQMNAMHGTEQHTVRHHPNAQPNYSTAICSVLHEPTATTLQTQHQRWGRSSTNNSNNNKQQYSTSHRPPSFQRPTQLLPITGGWQSLTRRAPVRCPLRPASWGGDTARRALAPARAQDDFEL